jgi:hypothetical protein
LLAKFVRDPQPTQFIFLLSGLRTALGTSATQAQAIQTAYNSSQQKVEELRAATLEACHGIEEGEAQVGSSMASRLHALGGHVTRRMHRSLHLGVQKALGVVASHYRLNLEAISTGYVIPEGLDDEVEMNRVDALAAPAAHVLTEDFMEFLFPDAPPASGLEPFKFLLELKPCGLCNKHILLKTFECCKFECLFSFRQLRCSISFPFARANLS